MKNRKNIAKYIIVLSGIVMRVIMAAFHFTHIDDIGVANSIIHLSHIIKNDEIGIAKEFCNYWTYAPFQSLITQQLVNDNMSYFLNIFMGRFPSLICGVLFVWVIYKILSKTQLNQNAEYSRILIICIISLSWENIIYSAQMEPYSIGALFGAIIVFLLIDKFYDNWEKTVISTILFSVACYAQYQMFILVFAMYIASFIYNLIIKNKGNLIRVVVTGAVNFITSVPLLIFLFTSGKLQQGVNAWNVGQNGIFMFQNIVDKNLFDILKYIFSFFTRNIFICFKYLFLADSFKYIANILTVILLIFACLGIYYIHRNKEYLVFAIFNDILMVILLVMIIKGNMTLGPSRHILFVEPILIMLIYFGIVQLSTIQRMRLYYCKIVITTICLIILLFVFSIPKELTTRKNFISEKFVCNLLDKYEPGFVFTEFNLADLYLFNIDGFSNNSEPTGKGWLQNDTINIKPKKDDSIVLISKNYSIDDIRIIENSMRQQLEERVNYFNLDKEWANIDNYTIAYKKEIDTDAEVEYARNYYQNYPNSLYLYVLKYNGN